MNSQQTDLVVLFDWSGAFDTVDYNVLARRLQFSFRITGTPLEWYSSYLTARRQRIISICGTLSDSFGLDWGVPQGSCLGPLLYIIYSSTFFKIVEQHLPAAHCYANDSQVYLSFKPDKVTSQQDAIIIMQNCIGDIRLWMEHDKLLNDEKTEFLILGTLQQLSKINISSITVGSSQVERLSVVKNLGTFLDDRLSMNAHINKVFNVSFYYIHNIWRIGKYLSPNSTETLIHAFITSRWITVTACFMVHLKYKLTSYKGSKMQPLG